MMGFKQGVALWIAMLFIILSPPVSREVVAMGPLGAIADQPRVQMIIVADYLYHWKYARMAAEGEAVATYEPEKSQQALRAYFPPDVRIASNYYPPVHMLLQLPFAGLDLLDAYFWFRLVSLAIFISGAALFFNSTFAVVGAMLFAPLWLSMASGQNGVLLAGLFMWGFTLLPRWPVAAGLAFGLICFKPHFFILVMPWLLWARHYRAFWSTGFMTAALMLGSVLAFGVEAWVAYLQNLSSYSQLLVLKTSDQSRWFSIYGALRNVDVPRALALGLHIASALAAIGLVALMTWRRASPQLTIAAFMVAVMLFPPYLFDYDAVLALIPIVLLFLANEGRWNWREVLVSGFIAFAPIAYFPTLGKVVVPQLMPLAFWLLLLLIWQRAKLVAPPLEQDVERA